RLKTTDLIQSVCPVKMAVCLSVLRSHSRTVLSLLPDARVFPSWLMAIQLTALEWSRRVARSWGSSAGHLLIDEASRAIMEVRTRAESIFICFLHSEERKKLARQLGVRV